MVVDDQGSKSTPVRSDNSDVELLILNYYNKNKLSYSNETSQNDNVLIDDASPSSNTRFVTEGNPPSVDSSHQ